VNRSLVRLNTFSTIGRVHAGCCTGSYLGSAGYVEARLLEIKMQKIRTFLKNSKGATAIEYGLIAALIAVAAIAAMSGLGTSLNNTFSNVSTTLDDNQPGS
jgi:pilus assembly protein Flp/PilA